MNGSTTASKRSPPAAPASSSRIVRHVARETSAGGQPKRRSAPEVGPVQRQLAQGDAPGSRDRDYWVYAPRRSRARRLLGRPAVVLLLHGCDQTAESLVRSTRFVEQAAARDYIVVFPHVTSWAPVPWRARNCWGFWIEAERHRDEGELGDLRRILDQVEREFGADPRRRYVAGLSSGGAMAVAMAVAYPDVVRAAGAVAGLAYGETSAAAGSAALPFCRTLVLPLAAGHPGPKMRSLPALVEDMEAAGRLSGEDRSVPLLVIQSIHDEVVKIENAGMLRDVACPPWRGRGRFRPMRTACGCGGRAVQLLRHERANVGRDGLLRGAPRGTDALLARRQR